MPLENTVKEDVQPTKYCQKFEGHTHWVRGVIHLPGGEQIMTCSSDGSLGVWNLQTGKQIANWRDGKIPIYCLALSMDGKKVASGSEDGVVRLWSIDTGEVIARWTGHTGIVHALCWNGGGERVLSGSRDGTVRVWDVETGKTVLEIKTDSEAIVYTAIYSADSTHIATSGSPSHDVKIWDANTGELVTILKGHTDWVNCLAWTADGRTLISGSHDNSIRTWSTSTWLTTAVLTAHTDSVFGIAISPNGRILASASWDHTARLWNLEDGQPIGLPFQHPDQVMPISFSTNGLLLATGCFDNNAYTWDIGAIVREAGLHELLLSPKDREKSFLDDDATPCPPEQPENNGELPACFFDDAPNHPEPTAIDPISPPSIIQGPSTISDSLSGSLVSQNPPPEVQVNSSERARPRFFKLPRRRKDEAIELQERSPAVADVPLAQGKLLNVSKGDVEKKQKRKRDAEMKRKRERKEEARKAKNANRTKTHATSSTLPSKTNVAQQSAGVSQPIPSSSSRAATPTPPITAPHANPDSAALSVAPPRAGCWTRFSLFIGVVSKHDSNSNA